MANVAQRYSYDTLAKVTRLRSVRTVERYLRHLQEAFLFFSLQPSACPPTHGAAIRESRAFLPPHQEQSLPYPTGHVSSRSRYRISARKMSDPSSPASTSRCRWLA